MDAGKTVAHVAQTPQRTVALWPQARGQLQSMMHAGGRGRDGEGGCEWRATRDPRARAGKLEAASLWREGGLVVQAAVVLRRETHGFPKRRLPPAPRVLQGFACRASVMGACGTDCRTRLHGVTDTSY